MEQPCRALDGTAGSDERGCDRKHCGSLVNPASLGLLLSVGLHHGVCSSCTMFKDGTHLNLTSLHSAVLPHKVTLAAGT